MSREREAIQSFLEVGSIASLTSQGQVVADTPVQLGETSLVEGRERRKARRGQGSLSGLPPRGPRDQPFEETPVG
jgi:hypothetical protein